MKHETNTEPALNENLLLNEQSPLPNDDPALKRFIAQGGKLYKNRSVIGLRPAIPGEPVETWIKGPDGNMVLERTTTAKEDDVVAVGVLGETYIPSKASIEKNRLPVGPEGLTEDEVVPPLPDDGHSYDLFRSNGQDYRMAVKNPFEDENIYLRTSSGRLQTGLPGGNIVAQLDINADPTIPVEGRLDVARFIGEAEFAASYAEVPPEVQS